MRSDIYRSLAAVAFVVVVSLSWQPVRADESSPRILVGSPDPPVVSNLRRHLETSSELKSASGVHRSRSLDGRIRFPDSNTEVTIRVIVALRIPIQRQVWESDATTSIGLAG